MQERHHVKTTPGEPKAPEVVQHPIRIEPGTGMQTDDINIPLVAVSVAFFAIFLLVLVIGIQAWFYNHDTAERDAKTVAQGAPNTPLGELLEKEHQELYAPAGPNPRLGKDVKGFRIPVDEAMTLVQKQYAALQGK